MRRVEPEDVGDDLDVARIRRHDHEDPAGAERREGPPNELRCVRDVEVLDDVAAEDAVVLRALRVEKCVGFGNLRPVAFGAAIGDRLGHDVDAFRLDAELLE